MARTAGPSTVGIPASTLAATLQAYPNLPVQVSKGWLAKAEELLGVSFGVKSDESESESESESETPAKADSKLTVEIG